jgi:nicotinamidase-related amidase
MRGCEGYHSSQQQLQTSFFNAATELADWIDDLRPLPGEMVFEHELPSCYSVDAFADFIAYIRDPSLIIAGFGANYTVLATAIDGFSRGHRIWFVREATGSYGLSGGLTHAHTCQLIEQFGAGLDVGQAIHLASGNVENSGHRRAGAT